MTSHDGGAENGGLAHLREQIDQVERGVLRRIDPGAKAMVIAVAVFVLVIAALLPWVHGVPGWQVLVDGPNTGSKADIVPRVFGIGVYVFGVLGSAVALGTRRWGVAWICSFGCGVSTVLGLVSLWSQQTSASHQPGPGPGAGLILAVLCMLVLAVNWARTVWSRPGGVFNRPTD
ncbi:MAG TPA: hypothetical protein VG317_21795 [Pseudonocardiaceae bacterium]|jgi:hypothetical protein|nr:hypothetical protein [Pseudonocardiaceae bacterium]